MKEKRDFKRYSCKTECEIRIGAVVCTGCVIDYSDGLGIISEKNPVLKKGADADIKILSSGEEIKAQIMWVREEGDDVRVGFKRTGNLRGSLKNFKHIDLLMGLQRGTKTGTLEVVSGTVVKKIFIKNGDMIFAASNLMDDRLGERLVKKGRISVEQFNLATQRLLETGEKIGKVLVDMCCMSPHELYQAVRTQVEDIILSIFEIEDGDFEFKEGVFAEENLVSLVFSAANIIYRGMKQAKNRNYIEQMFPPPDAVLVVSQHPINIFQFITLDYRDKEILQSINGKDPVSSLLSRFPGDDFETLKTISAFLCIGIVTMRGDERAPQDVSASDILEERDEVSAEEFIAAVDDLYTQCELADYYSFLGIDRTASVEDIQREYYSIAKRFHPDRHFSFPEYDLKSKLIKITTYATEANNVLCNPVMREKYDRKLLSNVQENSYEEVSPASDDQVRNSDGDEESTGLHRIGNEQELEEASVSPYEMGVAYMEMGLMKDAIHEFRNALKLTSKKVECFKMIAQCYINEGQNREAVEEMRKVMQDISVDSQEYMDIKYELADLYMKKSAYEEALALLEEIRADEPEYRDVAVKIESVSNLVSNSGDHHASDRPLPDEVQS